MDVTKTVTLLEVRIMKNYCKVSVVDEGRTELHDALNLTGAEISVNVLPMGVCVPFVHSHKQNEEIYAILEGKGTAVIDGETIPLKAGDWLRVSPAAKRRFSASSDSSLKYICVQAKENSLQSYTADDAVIG